MAAVVPAFNDEQARSIAATLRIPRSGERLASLPSGITLSVLEGPDQGAHAVSGAEINVGRGQLCDIRLADASISEFHFKLSLGDGEILLEDLDSSNGVWIGRARIQRASLLPGAVFRAGSCRFRLDGIITTSTAITDRDDFHGIRGVSPAMRSVFAALARASKTPLPILITGETGCGKGWAARAIHRASGRRGNFVTLDCTALPRDMADALVLGHVKGSFTGAHRDHPSPFEEADGGTLFLDEIGELPPDLQPKLLRVVDERVVQRVGSNRVREVDVRIVAATHRNLAQLISAQQFRADLFHRLSGLPIWLPPLRSRREDIRHLAVGFLEELAREVGKDLAFTSEAIAVLERLDWPGNIRELRQVVQRSAYLVEGQWVDRGDLLLSEEQPRKVVDVERVSDDGDRGDRDNDLPPLHEVLDRARRDYCTKLLASTGNLTEAADVAGYSPRGLRMLLQRLKIATL
jgi:transcriptional regulator with GAF, ATPase, and Fis domain